MFRITAAVLLTAATLATASCEKEEVIIMNGSGSCTTTTKAVKGTTHAKLWSKTRYAPTESPRDITEYSISNIFDVKVEVTAGGEKATAQMTDNTLTAEAATTSVPNSGAIKVTLTRKPSFTPDPAVTYVIDIGREFGYTTAYSDGSSTTKAGSDASGETLELTVRGSKLTKQVLDSYAQQVSAKLSGTCTQAFGY